MGPGESIKEAIVEDAKSAIGDKRRRSNEDWFDQECGDAIKVKNEARRAMLQRNTRRVHGLYEEKRRVARRICRLRKKEAMNKKTGKFTLPTKLIEIIIRK